MAAAAIAGPALLPQDQPADPDTSYLGDGGPTYGDLRPGGTDQGGEADGGDTDAFTVRIDDFGDAEAVAEQLREHGIDATAFDAVLDREHPADVLGLTRAWGFSSIVPAEPGSVEPEFTIQPADLQDGRIVIVMGMVDTIDPPLGPTEPAPWPNPVIVHVYDIGGALHFKAYVNGEVPAGMPGDDGTDGETAGDR